MKKYLFFLFLSFSICSFSQDKKIDQLEVYYSQEYYSKVVRKSKQLLANPDYDYSGLPKFYYALSQFRMAGDLNWFKKHKPSIKESIQLYNDFLEHSATEYYISAHEHEIANLKTYLNKLEKSISNIGYKAESELIHLFINQELKKIKGSYVSPLVSTEQNINTVENLELVSESMRDDIVKYAEQYIGVPYAWAGNSPRGFDCSGYTTYVLKEFNINLPRTASDQKRISSKINKSSAKKGDLVFFGKGNNITHVGIIVSEKGKPLTMIHASTSKGIIVTNIENSEYWISKFKGVGSVIE